MGSIADKQRAQQMQIEQQNAKDMLSMKERQLAIDSANTMFEQGMQNIKDEAAAAIEAARSVEVERMRLRRASLVEGNRERLAADLEAAQKMGEAVSNEMAKAFSSQSFSQSIAGPIEEMTRRLEVKLEQLKYGGR
jgi:hypothetical protein